MRLGWVIDGPLDQLSGGYLYDRLVVEHLLRRGHEVQVISLPPGPYLARLVRSADRGLAERIAVAGFDLVVQDELSHPALIGPNRRLRLLCPDLPRVALVHHLRSSEPAVWPARLLYRRVEKLYLRSVNAFIFNSRATRASVGRLRQDPAPEVVVVPGADRLPPVPGDPERHHRSGPLRLLFVGNLIPRKRLATLLLAIALLPPEAATLTVVGDPGADPAHTRRLMAIVGRYRLADRVTLLGPLGPEAVSGQMALHHALAIPSAYEGYGMAYLEGMGHGLPAIVGRAGGASEFVRDGVNGARVDPDDPPALAARLIELHRDRDRLTAMSHAARKTYLEHPTWSDAGETIERFLLGLAGQRRA